MCGIVGAVSTESVSVRLLNGLKKLEYRGYDSAGLAIINDQQLIQRLRLVGKVKELEHALAQQKLEGLTGIAHTRWATHGAPSENNSHPFTSHDELALVHNGIIENHEIIKKQLLKEGFQFVSDTDTEVIVHLIYKYFYKHNDLVAAIRAATRELKGSYALGIISKRNPNHLLAVRQGSPLVIGKGLTENFIASDPLALLSLTQQFIYLEDDDIADITPTSIDIFNKDNQPVSRHHHSLSIANTNSERGHYRHYMQKEIMEQPQAIASCLENRIAVDHVLPGIFGDQAAALFARAKQVQLIACGSSYHAALVARYWIEALANKSCLVEVASEFRYRQIATPNETLFVVLSQSGETADTLAALRLSKEMEYLGNVAICNVASSTMIRETQFPFLTHAGMEIGVASTKAFMTQLIALFLLTLSLSQHKISKTEEQVLVEGLRELPKLIKEFFKNDHKILKWAKAFMHKEHALFLGRGLLYPIAMEGALKMKEISYIHAEGYPCGELKHGPLALVDKNMPVIAMAPSNYLAEKTLSNLQEVNTRGGELFIFTDNENNFSPEIFSTAHLLKMPKIHPLLAPILYTAAIQLLAYHVAVLKGTDVDQPRNLAKSVTVE